MAGSNMFARMRAWLKSWWYRWKYDDYRIIADSGLFDAGFYTQTYPDVRESAIDPLLHYITSGYAEPRQPHPCFDPEFYIKQLPETMESGSNPLLHYIKTAGGGANHHPNYLFDHSYYRRQFQEVDWVSTTPLQHYLYTGHNTGTSPHWYFDPHYYKTNNPDVDWKVWEPLSHYLHQGGKERRQPSQLFDSQWYADSYAINRQDFSDVCWHYHDFGCREGKSPSPLFDPGWFRRRYHLALSDDPYRYFLENMQEADIQPCHWFVPQWYAQQYLSSEKSEKDSSQHGSSYEHYLSTGVWQGLYPNAQVAALSKKPLISIVVPVYNPSAAYLNTCIRSVLYQSYPHWQLCLADDASTAPHVRPLLEEWAARDHRIVVTFLEENSGIADATNAAAALATGEYLGFLDNDDELAPQCLFHLVEAINTSTADLLYTDEDLVGADGRRYSIFAKPDYNEALLLNHNYITHFVLCQRHLFLAAGGCRREMSGAQDYDLFLRMVEMATTIVHLPRILYHWRASETSTSINHQEKEYADEAGRRALAAACQRRQIDAEVVVTELKFYYRVKRRIAVGQQIHLAVWWNRPAQELESWLKNLLETACYPVAQVILLGPQQPSRQFFLINSAYPQTKIKVLPITANCSWAAAWQQAFATIETGKLCLLDSALTQFSQGWLEGLLEFAGLAETGCVSGRIHYRHQGRDEELPPLPDLSNTSPQYFARFIQQSSIVLNGLHCPQQQLLAAPQFFIIDAARWHDNGGFDEAHFPELFAVHDLCLRLHQQSLRCLYTPFASAVLDRCSKDAVSTKRQQQELEDFQKRWKDALLAGDPFYSRRLLEENDISLQVYANWLSGDSRNASPGEEKLKEAAV